MGSETTGAGAPPPPDPNTEPAFYGEIPGLVRDMFTKKGKAQRSATTRLTEGIQADPYFDSTLFAIDAAQKLFAGATNPTLARDTASFMQQTLLQYAETVAKDITPKMLHITPKTKAVAKTMLDTFEKLPENKQKQLATNLPYAHMITQVLPAISQSQETFGFIPTFSVPIEKLQEMEEKRSTRASWEAKLHPLLIEKVYDPAADDEIIDSLIHEPQGIKGEMPLYETPYADLTLQDIFSFPYPPTDEQMGQITSFVTEFLKSSPDDTQRLIMARLFFGSHLFFDMNIGHIPHAHRPILATLATWQERTVDAIFFEQSAETEEQTRAFIEALTDADADLLLDNTLDRILMPTRQDPEATSSTPQRSYPLTDLCINAYKKTLDEHDSVHVYIDEIARTYFVSEVIPLLQNRLTQFGLSGKFESTIQDLVSSDVLNSDAFAKEHLHLVQDTLDRLGGTHFVEQLDEKKDAIAKIADTIWQDSVEAGDIHFLPLQEGFSTITFSPNTIPRIAGLDSISLQRRGTDTNWNISFQTRFRDTEFTLMGSVDQNGNYTFSAPFQTEMPAAYQLFRYVTNAAISDLSVARKVIPPPSHGTHSVEKSADDIPEEPDRETEDLQQATQSESSPTQRFVKRGTLPRTVYVSDALTDKDVMDAVSTITLRPNPRIVELKPYGLAFSRHYRRAVREYEQASSREDGDAVSTAAEKLTRIREDILHSPSAEKLRDLPKGVSLETITDPLTGEPIYVQTWHVEYVSPAPTDAEKADPRIRFENIYRGGSALASLQELLGWLTIEKKPTIKKKDQQKPTS